MPRPAVQRMRLDPADCTTRERHRILGGARPARRGPRVGVLTLGSQMALVGSTGVIQRDGGHTVANRNWIGLEWHCLFRTPAVRSGAERLAQPCAVRAGWTGVSRIRPAPMRGRRSTPIRRCPVTALHFALRSDDGVDIGILGGGIVVPASAGWRGCCGSRARPGCRRCSWSRSAGCRRRWRRPTTRAASCASTGSANPG